MRVRCIPWLERLRPPGHQPSVPCASSWRRRCATTPAIWSTFRWRVARFGRLRRTTRARRCRCSRSAMGCVGLARHGLRGSRSVTTGPRCWPRSVRRCRSGRPWPRALARRFSLADGCDPATTPRSAGRRSRRRSGRGDGHAGATTGADLGSPVAEGSRRIGASSGTACDSQSAAPSFRSAARTEPCRSRSGHWRGCGRLMSRGRDDGPAGLVHCR